MNWKTFNCIATIILFSSLCFRCNTQDQEETSKYDHQDPFKRTIVKSQYFTIDPEKDNVVEGTNGTTVVLPKGCFRNSEGDIVTENVKIELAEALSLDQMILSNLTTHSNGKLLETDGMIYFEATANGKRLQIDQNNPVYVEIPTAKRKPNMMVYEGERDKEGNMNWIDPKPLDNYLIPVDLDLLDFLPDGFETLAMNGSGIFDQEITQEFVDSLYYSFSVSDGSEWSQGLVNIPVANHYTQSYYQDSAMDEAEEAIPCGIDPAAIKVIKSGSFQNTLISTKEFETRLQLIHNSCRDDILKLYIKNLDQNLWFIDSLAAVQLKNEEVYKDFVSFYKQKLTKLKNTNPYVNLLKDYYEKQLRVAKKELNTERKKLLKSLEEKNRIARELIDDYEKLLFQRERYWMESYGFRLTKNGWINVDKDVATRSWEPYQLDIVVDNYNNVDIAFAYIVHKSVKSISKLNSTGDGVFNTGSQLDNQILMSKDKSAAVMAIGYKNEETYFTMMDLGKVASDKLTLTLRSTTKEELSKILKAFETSTRNNYMDTELEFLRKFAKEKRRQKQLREKSQFLQELNEVVYPCCSKKTITLSYGADSTVWKRKSKNPEI